MTVATHRVMYVVLAALMPGIAVQVYFFGPGVIVNLVLALAFAAVIEWGAERYAGGRLKDGSALLTAVLLAVALPPATAPLLLLLGVVAALVLGKHLYGGLGANLFNPAMVGYAVLLISFPGELASWPGVDAATGATPLDAFKHRGGLTVVEFAQHAAPDPWPWINLAYLGGGMFLVLLRAIDWRIPAALLATVAAAASLGFDAGSSSSLGSPGFHLSHGAVMLGAFFIATDPVTCPTTSRGRALFGVLVGILVYVIRSWAAYPDAIAFAVLLGNAATPLIDVSLAVRRRRHA